MNKRLSVIQLRQLEERLERVRDLAALESPQDGWVRTLRQALGMTTSQLASRMGVTRQAVLQMEAAERKQTVTWSTLRKAATAMECEVVYAVVPKGSLNQVLLRRGRTLAEKHVDCKDEPKSRKILQRFADAIGRGPPPPNVMSCRNPYDRRSSSSETSRSSRRRAGR